MSKELYPPAPFGIPADLATPSAGYKRQTAAAVIGVALFFIFYFCLTGWFALVTYRAIRGFASHPERTFLVGIPAAFLFLVLAKGLFIRKKMSRDSLIQLTADEEPDFVAFIHKVAQETGAKLPAKIYLSADVNAAVFLDVGLINLLIPTKKNLIMGLGLVNSLTLDELKAVVAHEFGHFAQRSMGVSQWVYLARGFVGDLMARRDIFDRFVQGLSRIDFRIAWIGWILRVLVWALRAVVDQFFRFVELLGRALSRQMEFQADLVSVRVSGSDSLVHALHRLHAADRGWGEAANFVIGDARRGRMTEDLFAIQTRFIERYREVHALSEHGATPERPERGSETHRVFARTIADTPRMWSTHPSNKEREENCKATYFASNLDTRSAWSVFRDPDKLRRRVTRHFIDLVLNDPNAKPTSDVPERVFVPVDESLARVDEIFGRPSLDRTYQGLYTTMQITRAIGRNDSLWVEPSGAPDKEQLLSSFEKVFEPGLADEVEEFFTLDDELANLEGLRKGFLKAPGGVIIHRGDQLRRKDLAGVVDTVRGEFESHRSSLAERFRQARGIALRIARGVDSQRPAGEDWTTWEKHLQGLLGLLHYAEHTAGELIDVVSYFEHVLAIVFADGHVSNSEIRRLEGDGGRVAVTLKQIYAQRTSVNLCEPVRLRLTKDGISWEELIGPELHLQAPLGNDFAHNWIGIAESWWGPYISSLNALSSNTLDVLIETEELLMNSLRKGTDPGDAPPAASVPGMYDKCCYGDELKRQERLGWWDRFQVAEGFAGGFMRFVVAAAVLAPAFFAGFLTSKTEMWVHNGLGVPAVVMIDGESVEVWPGRQEQIEVVGGELAITTTTRDGRTIESFVSPDVSGMSDPVYNVAGATGFARWWAVYGSAREHDVEFEHGRIVDGDASHLFEEPPNSMSSSGSGTSTSVFEAMDNPIQLFGAFPPEVAQEMAMAHLEWDPPSSPNYLFWVYALPDAERAGYVSSLYAEEPTPRLLMMNLSLMSVDQETQFCDAAMTLTAPAGHAAVEAAYCARDARIIALANTTNDPWVQLMAGDQCFRDHRFDDALNFYRRASSLQGNTEANLSSRTARTLRLLGRFSEASELPSDEAMYDFYNAIERHDPAASEPGRAAWARQSGRFDPSDLGVLSVAANGDDLALGAGSLNAPESWRAALAQSNQPFQRANAAVVAWGLSWPMNNTDLRERAAQAYAALNGPLDLSALDMDAYREHPELLLAGESQTGLDHQTHTRLVGIMAWGDSAPQEWRTFVEAALFMAERPHVDPAR